MRVGVVFPQTEIAADAAVIRDWAQAVEGMGFDHIIAYDHVMGANLASRPDWKMPYNHDTPFHEPITLFAFLAGVTTRLELASGIIILPQRQAALFAARNLVGVSTNQVIKTEFGHVLVTFNDRIADEGQFCLLRQIADGIEAFACRLFCDCRSESKLELSCFSRTTGPGEHCNTTTR